MPEPSAELRAAEARHQEAAAEMASASVRMRAAEKKDADAKNLGRPSEVSAKEMSEVIADMERCSKTEAEAQESLGRILEHRRKAVQIEMADVVGEFAETIKRKVAELDALLALGTSVGDSYHRGGHLKTPEIFTACPLLKNYLRPMRAAMQRSGLAK
ncbi:hypothetical protein EN807_10505 [Mesorhizobium sp. M5C.F.Ca.ET.164.01.1.1]|nr:hypothetical protein EN807_10505 [Mesorhizobium sp. M5C.F.Ca.ET.164.01.1.1]